MKNLDIRWQQRFQNYLKAFNLLEDAVNQFKAKGLTELEKEGLIQRFEFTHELAWNVLKDYLNYQGISSIIGSRDTIREAFNKGLIHNGEEWMSMIVSRNKSTHTYNEETANELVDLITKSYFELFSVFKDTMTSLLQS